MTNALPNRKNDFNNCNDYYCKILECQIVDLFVAFHFNSFVVLIQKKVLKKKFVEKLQKKLESQSERKRRRSHSISSSSSFLAKDYKTFFCHILKF